MLKGSIVSQQGDIVISQECVTALFKRVPMRKAADPSVGAVLLC